MIEHFDVVIVGAGHGGAQAALMLRQTGFTGTIAMVGEESELPYERPPLSKDYLAGEKAFDRLLIRPAAFWSERSVVMRLGEQVVLIEADAHVVVTDAGASIGYGSLVWATGGRPRNLVCTGHDLVGVHTVRTRADADRMKSELAGVRRAVIIGGGFIGLEAAAVLAKMAMQVVVLEAMDRVLARVAAEPLSRFYEAEHRAHGVQIRTNVKVDCIEERDGRVVGVRLHDGEILACEMVIVGIGIVPAVGPLIAAGAQGGNGVQVDGACRTSLPNVFAIGDCALHANAFAKGANMRVESVQNANDMAAVVAKNLSGIPTEYHAVPWFWSNQYDLRLQTVGLSTGYDDVVIRGDITARSFSIVYLKRGQVIALDCVNATRDYVQGRALVTSGALIAVDALADTTLPLKSLMA